MEIVVNTTKKIPAPEYITMVYESGQDVSMLYSNTVYNSGVKYVVQSIQKELREPFQNERTVVMLAKAIEV